MLGVGAFGELALGELPTFPAFSGWASASPEVFVRPVPAGLHQDATFEELSGIVSITPQGWASQSPDVFVRAFNAAQQQFVETGLSIGEVPTPATPRGW